MPSEATEGSTTEATMTTQALNQTSTQTSAQTSTQTPTSVVPFAEALQGGLGSTLLQMGGAVVVVVALILILQKTANRLRPGWGGRSRDGGIEILSQRALGNRLSLLVVQTHGQTLLVGTSPQGVTPVATLGAAATVDSVGTGTSAFPIAGSAPTLVATQNSAAQFVAAPSDGSAAPSAEGSRPTGKTRPTMSRPKLPSAGGIARGVLRSIAARAVSKRPVDVARSGLADLEEASRIAREARARDEASEEFDIQEFEAQFREKLRAIREKYPTLDEAEGRRA